MSGGSFNYLGANINNWGVQISQHGDLLDMIDTLKEYGSLGCEAADDLEQALSEFQQRCSALADVMHAVEWNRSGDWGSEPVHEALRKWYESYV